MGNCSTCSSKATCGANKSDENKCGKISIKYGNIKNVIGVISGKGGVGKSTVSGILAVSLAKKGYKVGVLDADITGPSMPRFFGVNEQRARVMGIDEKTTFFEPVISKSGVKIMSMNLLVEKEEDPVIWRGPVVTGVLTQMFTDTHWGELDYLIIDMPPGTSDITLTIMQSFPIFELIVVSTPQDMVSMIVKKVVTMAEKMGIKIRGLIENMAYILCNDCDRKLRVFSNKSSEEHAEYLELPLLGELPINIELTEAIANETVEKYIMENSLYSLIFEGLY